MSEQREPLPITAILASHNEAAFLERALPRLSFCDERIVIDIDSDDSTAAVAEAHGARVIRHSYVPIAEFARAEAIASARHDWLLLLDPDEEMPGALAEELVALFPQLDDDVGLVGAPMVYHFARRPLRGTIWGGVQPHRVLVRRSAVDFGSTVHTKLPRRPGFRDVNIPYNGHNALIHHWASGYRAFLEKHIRYLKLEGPARADAGQTTSLRGIAGALTAAFRESYIARRGADDGLRGLSLSILWALYSAAAQAMLWRELRQRRRRL